MSTLKATNIKNVSSGTNNLVLGENGGVVISGLATVSNANVTGGSITGVSTVSSTAFSVNGNAYPNAGPLSNRNLIINGAMQVAQRGTQVTGETSGGYLTCDRFRPTIGTLGTWTVDQSTDAPNGFSNSLKLTCTTADASPAAGDKVNIRYLPEGQDLQGLAFGTADAKSFVVSFWVKSNKTGTATLSIIQIDDSNALVSPTYTINSADTWEHKIIVIPGNTNAGIDNDNSLGLYIDWNLNSGSTYSSGTNRTTWSTYANADINPSNLGVGGATSDYFAITGVQLEVGSVATPFEHRSYGDELRRCQRYYYPITLPRDTAQVIPAVVYSTSTILMVQLPVTLSMRATPTLATTIGTAQISFYKYDGTGNVIQAITTFNAGTRSSSNVYWLELQFTGASSWGSGGNSGSFYFDSGTSSTISLSAEL